MLSTLIQCLRRSSHLDSFAWTSIAATQALPAFPQIITPRPTTPSPQPISLRSFASFPTPNPNPSITTTTTNPKKADYKILLALHSFEEHHIKHASTHISQLCQSIKLHPPTWAAMPIKRTLFTLLRSPHIHKKARDQYQMLRRKHVGMLHTQHLNTANMMLQIVKELQLPGVEVHVKVEYPGTIDT
jgi:small subunit ribosomal protein S10